MKKFYLLFLGIFAYSMIGCSSIDVAVSPKVDVNKKMKKIIVFPFDVKGVRWGDEFSDAITHNFVKAGKMDVVEREALSKILKEQKLSMTGLIDEGSAVKVGKLLGADVIIIGRGTALRKHVKGKPQNNLIDTLALKAINVETGSVILTVRKEEGSAWSGKYYAMYCLGGTMIWDREDIYIKSSNYDEIARQIVSKVSAALDDIEKQKNLKK